MNSKFMELLLQFQARNNDFYIYLGAGIIKVKIIAISGDWVILNTVIDDNNVDLNLHYGAVIPVTSP